MKAACFFIHTNPTIFRVCASTCYEIIVHQSAN